MIATITPTARPASTIEAGSTLHINNTTFTIIALDLTSSPRSMRAFYFTETEMDFLVLDKHQMVFVS